MPSTKILRHTALVAAALTGSACSSVSEPEANDVEWAVERTADKKGYRITGSAILARGLDGWYQPEAILLDDRGCSNAIQLPATQIANEASEGTVAAQYDEVLKLKRPVATAEFKITYMEAPLGATTASEISHTRVFSEERVVDASLQPPLVPKSPCGGKGTQSRREQLREQAKTDPDGADAAAIGDMSRNELVATAINTAGFLCAKVTEMYPSGGDIVVSCTEYRSGGGRAKYRVDTASMTVEQIS